jgi:radical SAM superfamily enzyme YgiQ (UPF0313 family)
MIQGEHHRERPPEIVVKEIEDIVNNHKITRVLFRDAIFTLNKERVIKICQLINKKRLNFKWWCETRINYLDSQLLQIMKNAGLEGIKIGVETGDPKVLTKIAKPSVSFHQLKSITKSCKELDIKTHFLLMIGLPGETKKSFFLTLKLIKKLNPNSIGILFTVPYPGTDLYTLAKKNNWIKTNNWSLYDGNHPIMVNENLKINDLTEGYKIIKQSFSLQKSKKIVDQIRLFKLQKHFKKWAEIN